MLMNTANPNHEDRAAAADDAQRRYFPESYREDALESGDPERIFRSLGGSDKSLDISNVIGFVRAVGRMNVSED